MKHFYMIVGSSKDSGEIDLASIESYESPDGVYPDELPAPPGWKWRCWIGDIYTEKDRLFNPVPKTA